MTYEGDKAEKAARPEQGELRPFLAQMPASRPRPKILVVDDVPANLLAVKRVLAKVDAEVMLAGSGNDALALTLDHDFALLLLDVQMPGMNGYEVAELLRGEERTRNLPIIFVTAAYKDDHHRLKGYGAGAVDYIEKPINDEVLLSKVRIFIDLYKSRTELIQLLSLIEYANKRLNAEIQERRRSEEETRQLAGTVFANAIEGIMVCDGEANIVAVNPAFTKITGYTTADVVGHTPRILKSGLHDAEFYSDLWSKLLEGGSWQGEIWNRRKDGEIYPEWLSVSAIRDGDGQISRYVAIFTDITKRKQDEEQIWRQANFDALTGLPNRSLFLDRLSRALAESRRSGQKIALMFVDLDHFKLVNDTLGHALGDVLLREAAERLIGCVRDSDTVARLGGDEFTIILKGVSTAEDVVTVAEKINGVLAQPFFLDGQQVQVGGSIGITLCPDDSDEVGTLLRNADMAMYRAKEAGRSTFAFYTAEINEKVQNQALLGNELRRAIQSNQFLVYYQPIVDGESLAVVGAEALVRWQHPRLGLVPPADFIPLAEEVGLIGPLTQLVLATACRDAVHWQRHGQPPVGVSVNLSSRLNDLGAFAAYVHEVLAYTGLPPQLLTLEITESFVIDNSERMLSWLDLIRQSGIRLAIDDFGTGYSSLGYLRRLPVDTVKIDRSFVSEVNCSTADAALIEAIISMAHALKMKVVAEGVETPNQLSFLRSVGCDQMQGYLFRRPLPADQFEDFLAAHTPPPDAEILAALLPECGGRR